MLNDRSLMAILPRGNEKKNESSLESARTCDIGEIAQNNALVIQQIYNQQGALTESKLSLFPQCQAVRCSLVK